MPINISASLISDFISCNKRTFYRINHPELSIPNKEMILGSIIHDVIENKWLDRLEAMKTMYEKVNSSFPDDWEAIDFGSRCLTFFFDKFQPLLKPEDKIEVNFRIPYSSDVNIVGRIDRISNECLFDWKTSRYPPKTVSSNVQFILYNWAYNRLYSGPPKGVYYASLFNGNLVMYKHDEVAERVLFKEIIPTILYSIKSGTFAPTGYFNKSCYRCAFSNTCLKELENVELDSTTSNKK